MQETFAYAEPVHSPADATATDAEYDAALARRVASASPQLDAAAEAELCRRFAPRVRLYGLKYLRNPAAAADLVQDVLLNTLQRLRGGTIREPERLASFVLSTCRQMVIDRGRSDYRRERILSTFSLDVLQSDVAPAEPLDVDQLQNCLQQLAERERSVVLMSFYDDRPAAEVAQELGLSAANVRVIRHRSVERLRHCMESA